MKQPDFIDNQKPILSTGFRATDMNSREGISDEKLKEIHEMSRDELIQIIVRGNVPFLEEGNLANQETEVLRRLTFLAINQNNDLA